MANTSFISALLANKVAADNAHKGDMASSATVCLDRASAAISAEDWDAVKRHSLKSLAYSVGMFDPAYQYADSL